MGVPFRLGNWLVQPQLNRIVTPDGEIPLQPKAMAVLVYLARRPGEVVTKDELFRDVWTGVFVTDEALTYVIWELRKALTDDAKQPRFIQTISKKGYRLIAPVSFDDAACIPPSGQERSKRHHSIQRGTLFVMILAAGIVTWWLTPKRGVSDSTVALDEREWVLISRFENRTGESVWDGAVEFLLEGEMLRSRIVSVVSRERVGDVLRLMRRPIDTEVDSALAREIALRDGAIKAIFAGRIERRGSGYSLTAAVIDPATGATVSMASAGARSQDQIGQAVRILADDLRRALGEHLLLGEARRPAPKVTTHSLAAFRLFSQGMLFVDQKKWQAAIELLERAVAADPEFASAHIYLAHSYQNLERGEEAAPHYEKAFSLANTLSDRERYFIIGSYYSYRGDAERAAHAYQILVELYPDHFWGLNNLAIGYFHEGRTVKALPFALRAADLRPNDFSFNSRAAWYLMADQGRTTHLPYFHRARALVSPETVSERPWDVANLEFFPAQEAWNAGDTARALEEVERLSLASESHGSAVTPYLLERAGRGYLSLGLLQAAEKRFRAMPDEIRRSDFLAQIARARGDEATFAKHREAVDISSHIRTYGMDASAFVLTGSTASSLSRRSDRIVRVLDSMQRELPPGELVAAFVRSFSTGARGELALASGRLDDAISLLEQAVDQLKLRPRPAYFLAVESLADALEQKGDRERALQVLKEAARLKQRAFEDGLYWMRVAVRLADLYRKLGHEKHALEIENELRRLLVYADPDHVIVRSLGIPR